MKNTTQKYVDLLTDISKSEKVMFLNLLNRLNCLINKKRINDVVIEEIENGELIKIFYDGTAYYLYRKNSEDDNIYLDSTFIQNIADLTQEEVKQFFDGLFRYEIYSICNIYRDLEEVKDFFNGLFDYSSSIWDLKRISRLLGGRLSIFIHEQLVSSLDAESFLRDLRQSIRKYKESEGSC